MVGVLANSDAGSNLAISYERTLNPNFSIVGTAGILPYPEGINRTKLLTYHLGIEGRCYIAHQRNLPMSGLFVGVFLAYSESYVWYMDVKKKAQREFYPSAGISLGYQLLLWKHFRVSGDLLVGRHGKIVSEQWDKLGFRRTRYEWSPWWVLFPSFSIGYSF